PPQTNPAAATMTITWRETGSYVRRMGIGAGAAGLVLGSGGNGLALAAHAANSGAHTVMLGSASRHPQAQRVGVAQLIDYRADDGASQLTGIQPAGFDFVIDAVGKQAVLELGIG